MIAMALAVKPKLLIADEPTSALDVTIQAQILQLLDELVRMGKNAVILITHDLGIASEFCDRITVMYAGNVIEVSDSQEVFQSPCTLQQGSYQFHTNHRSFKGFKGHPRFCSGPRLSSSWMQVSSQMRILFRQMSRRASRS